MSATAPPIAGTGVVVSVTKIRTCDDDDKRKPPETCGTVVFTPRSGLSGLGGCPQVAEHGRLAVWRTHA